MNDSDKGGLTISSLLLTGMIISLAIPEGVILILGVMRGAVDATIFTAVAAGAALVVLVGVLTVSYFVRRRIQDRLLSLVDVCRNFAGGDRAVRAAVAGDDEFAMLSMSLNSLLDNQNTTGNTASQSNGGDAAALQAQIEKLLQEVSAVGDGDLRVQAEVTPDTLGVLADSFNYMIEELAKVVGRVQATALQVTNATQRILDRTNELTTSSEGQVIQISHTTRSVEELAVVMQNVAQNAGLSAEVAQEALRNANAGQEAVKQSIEGMVLIRENVQETSKKIKRLGERSNEIGEIVLLIDDIADQTNLLALNAAIQSAMAGEHGRGFAVVADEIRLLAERSTESTKRIATLVKSIQGDTYEAVVAMEDSTQEVVKGSQLADEAGRALNSIYSAVERQTQMIESIALAANEQAQVSEGVAIAMSEISEIAQQTNTGMQESSMNVSYLAELSDQLRASVSTFRLPERAGEMSNMLPAEGISALAQPGGDQYFQQDMNSNGVWNQGFSSDFLSLPQPVGSSHSGSHQFAFNNKQEQASQQGFAPAQQFGSQPGFEAQQFGQQFQPQYAQPPQQFGNQQGYYNQPGFQEQQSSPAVNQPYGGQPFGGQPGPGYTQFNDGMGYMNGDQGGFDFQQGFEMNPQFNFGADSSPVNPNPSYFQAPNQEARFSQPQQGFGGQPSQPSQTIAPRPRVRNPQQNQPVSGQGQGQG